MKIFNKKLAKILFALFLSMLLIENANALPSFARQTGMSCVACHTSFPELTPFGREFKLNGYTLGDTQWFPFAVMATASTTSLKNNDDGAGGKIIPRDGAVQLDAVSVFMAGKINDHIGGFVQLTENNHPQNYGEPQHHSALDNTDLRAVYNLSAFDKNLLIGMTFNNSPGVQDVWNTVGAWSFPFNQSMVPGVPGSTGLSGPLLDQGQPLAHTVAGLGGYLWWDRHLYGELTMYGDANRTLGFMSAGNSLNGAPILEGHNNPYWRLAWNEEWGANSLMVGTSGMRVGIESTITPGVVNRFTDVGVDTQYQHISDPHIFTAQASFLHERQNYNDAVITDNLNIFRAKASYLYDRTYGASLGFVNVTGTSDQSLYASQNLSCGSTPPDPLCNGNPGARYWITELDYNFNPQVRLMVQYTIFTKLDQAALDPNSVGVIRKPSDNNTLWFATWFAI